MSSRLELFAPFNDFEQMTGERRPAIDHIPVAWRIFGVVDGPRRTDASRPRVPLQQGSNRLGALNLDRETFLEVAELNRIRPCAAR